MLDTIRENRFIKKFRKTFWYARLRQQMMDDNIVPHDEDLERLASAEKILIDWPEGVKKPACAIVKDFISYPRWTKYVRFLENNHFPYEIFDLNAYDWMERAKKFDVFIGTISNEYATLQEMRKKYFALENYMGKYCFPSTEHIMIYEDKTLEAYASKAYGIPFAQTYISNNKKDALQLIENLRYPVVHKVDPGSGSFGVELVQDRIKAKKIVEQAFSKQGRQTHSLYFRQKNMVYFQDFIPNDGYDIRVMIVDNWAFGYYRKVLEGDFRASGMNMVEKRALPEEAVRLAWNANKCLNIPLLVMDMVHGLDGKYYVVEFSPICQMETPEQLHVDGVPGTYVIEKDGAIHFQNGKYWVHELSLREFFLKDYLPRVS